MNVENANCEPFFRFHRVTEEFDRNIKILFGALQSLGRIPAGQPGSLIELPTGGEPWGDGSHTKWRTLTAFATDAGGFLSHMGLVYLMAAFEDLLTGAKAEHDRFVALSGGSPQPTKSDAQSEYDHSFISLITEFGWDERPVSFLLPLLEYFVTARNCIVHRAGRANTALVAQSKSKLVSNALAAWPNTRGKKPPTLPEVELGEVVRFLPRHSLFAKEVCYKAALYLNAQLRDVLGAHGIVNMAAHYTLLAEIRVRTGARRSAVHIINLALTDRYRVRGINNAETVAILKEIGKWERCVRAHGKLFPGEV